MSKIHICGITMAEKLNDLSQLLQPLYPYYDALNWVFHKPIDEGLNYLESIKKDGKIQVIDFCDRLNFSRNHYLFNGTMKTGDYFIMVDDLERLNPAFFSNGNYNIKQLISFLESNKIDGCVLQGKRFLYRFNEFLEYRGNPHEYIVDSTNQPQNIIELTSIDFFKDPSWFWSSVRNKKRDKYEFVWHYLFYFTFPGSNHCLLGNEKNIEQFYKDESVRRQFRLYLEHNNYLPFTKEKFIWLCNNKLVDIKDLINKNKILNDGYRHFILGRTDFNDDHDYRNMILV